MTTDWRAIAQRWGVPEQGIAELARAIDGLPPDSHDTVALTIPDASLATVALDGVEWSEELRARLGGHSSQRAGVGGLT